MGYPLTSCLIWGGSYDASGLPIYPTHMARVDDSPRTGGGYMVPWPSTLVSNLSDKEKARLTTWLVDQRTHGDELPAVTEAVINHIKTKPSLEVYERADRLLRFVAESLDTLGDHVTVSSEDCDAACAWSESIEWKEVFYLLSYLKAKGWLGTGIFQDNMFKGWPTVDGYNRIEERRTNVDASQAFVAMWFHDSMDEAFENGIEPAIREAGYIPLRIDRKEHVNKIDDEIIAELRRSRFLVADFTHGDDGARGGVYYEAGFAHGLDLRVIFTCREDVVESLHFDTEHYNHIVWTTPADLREKLKNRILAVIGEGPGAIGIDGRIE